MKKRTVKVRFFYGYMDLSPFAIFVEYRIRLRIVELNLRFIVSSFCIRNICFAKIGRGAEKQIR